MLTDHEEKVLQNLRDCVAANCGAASGVRTAVLPAPMAAAAAGPITAEEMHDPDDADSCDELDAFFTADIAPPAASPEPIDTTSWDFVSHLGFDDKY